MLKFVSLVYCEGVLIAMKENGDVWQFNPHTCTWIFMAHGPLSEDGL
jgi:hypothetical protein